MLNKGFFQDFCLMFQFPRMILQDYLRLSGTSGHIDFELCFYKLVELKINNILFIKKQMKRKKEEKTGLPSTTINEKLFFLKSAPLHTDAQENKLSTVRLVLK